MTQTIHTNNGRTVTYDPDNHNDPLRHRYMDRQPAETFKVPVWLKILTGLGYETDKYWRMIRERRR